MQTLRKAILDEISNSVAPTAVLTWLSDCSIPGIRGDELVIAVPNKFKKDMITARLSDELCAATEKHTGSFSKVKLLTADELTAIDPGPEQSFSSFVSGGCSEYALAAALAVADRPCERVYSPLYVYGAPGSGKTHLLKAVQNRVSPSGVSVLYYTAGQLISELPAIPSDALVIADDAADIKPEQGLDRIIGLLTAAGDNGCRIILSGTCAPDLLPEELKLFVQSGVAADLQYPDIETRMAILNDAALRRGCIISDAESAALAGAEGDSVTQLLQALETELALLRN